MTSIITIANNNVPTIFLPNMNRRAFGRTLSAVAAASFIAIDSQKPAHAFLLETIAYCFLVYGFGSAAKEIYMNRRDFRENQAENGSAGAVNGAPKLMLPHDGQFSETKYGVNGIEASALGKFFDETKNKLYPNGQYGSATAREMDIWKGALSDFGYQANGNHDLRAKPYLGQSGQARILAGNSIPFLDNKGNYTGNAIPLVVSYGTERPRFYKIDDPTRA